MALRKKGNGGWYETDSQTGVQHRPEACARCCAHPLCLVVHKPVEFTLAITSMLNGWKSQRLHPPRFSLFTELLRLLGIHPKRSSRFLWREELQSVLDATRNQHGHFLMSGECHSEYVFSLARMRKNCLRLRRRIRDI